MPSKLLAKKGHEEMEFQLAQSKLSKKVRYQQINFMQYICVFLTKDYSNRAVNTPMTLNIKEMHF